jgi:hypothetical protein
VSILDFRSGVQQQVHFATVLKSSSFAIAKDWERFSLAAFCGVTGAKGGRDFPERIRALTP